MRKGSVAQKYAWLIFVLPALLTIALLIVYPIVYGTIIGFFDTNLMNKWNFVGLDNFIEVYTGSAFLESLWVTIRFTIFVVAGHVLFGMGLALLLNRKIKMRGLFRGILMVPYLFPEIVWGVVFKWILNPMYGIINYALTSLNLINEPISWLGTAEWAFPSMCFIAILKGYPFMMLMVLAGLQSIPYDLYEAGAIDGCTGISAFRYITIPSLMPVFSVTLLLDTVAWFKHFNLASILTNGGPGTSTMLISNHVYLEAFQHFKFGEASAAAVFIFVICYIIGYLYRKMIKD